MLSPLFKLAVLAGAEAAIRFHLRRGDDINATDADGRSPLFLAALKGNAQLCSLLLAEGADPLLPDKEAPAPSELPLAKERPTSSGKWSATSTA